MSTEKTYRIKKLVWDKLPGGRVGFRANIPLGTGYEVWMGRIGWCWDGIGIPTQFADSPEDAKSAAESHWHSRITQALEEVEG